jgi:hypothetical protein
MPNLINRFLRLFKKNYVIVIKETIINSKPSECVYFRPIETLEFSNISEVAAYLKAKNLTRPNSRSFSNDIIYQSQIGVRPKLTVHLEKGWGTFSKKNLYRLVK